MIQNRRHPCWPNDPVHGGDRRWPGVRDPELLQILREWRKSEARSDARLFLILLAMVITIVIELLTKGMP